MKAIKTTCPLDCYEQCALLVTEDRGRIISIEPDPDHPVTGASICSKGKKIAERINHPHRLRYPLLKKGGTFKEISWPEALSLMGAKITEALEKSGPLSLLHYYDGGYSGLLKNIEGRFFSALGGSTTHQGSLCWGAGLAAQKYDFGAVMAHPYRDLLNARLILIWGRNPAHTAIHLQALIRQAGQKGARVILIDPVRTATSAAADQHLRVKPGTDGALALALANVIMEQDLADRDFVRKYCSGYSRFAAMCKKYTPEKASALTGLEAETIQKLALDYGNSKPAAILIGIGPQRHSNGGNSVRAIDALAALTGNVGLPGGGASYANFRVTRHIDHAYLAGDDLAPRRRFYAKPRLAESLIKFADPPVEFIYVSRSNPLVQVGDSNRLRQAFSRVPFMVTSEHFMTDTASCSDLVLPATSFLEEEDLFFNSMSHQYLTYGAKVLDPPGECRPEYDYFRELAGLLDLDQYPDCSPEEILARAVKPLTESTGITFERIKVESPLLMPGGDDIPWANRSFETADGKYNFYSAAAEKAGCGGLPHYREPHELTDQNLRDEGYRYWFLTPHPRDSIHSTHRLPDGAEVPFAYLHPQTAAQENLSEGRRARISSRRGSIEAAIKISDRIPPDTVMVYEGWWHSSGAAVNNLTPDRITDMGVQAAYYDCLCRIDSAF